MSETEQTTDVVRLTEAERIDLIGALSDAQKQGIAPIYKAVERMLADREAAARAEERERTLDEALAAIAGAPDFTFRHSIDRTRAEDIVLSLMAHRSPE